MHKRWNDEHLIWDPEVHGNQTKLTFSTLNVWTPDIVLFNSAEIIDTLERESTLIEVSHTGIARWMFPNMLRSYCSVDIKLFPFDK